MNNFIKNFLLGVVILVVNGTAFGQYRLIEPIVESQPMSLIEAQQHSNRFYNWVIPANGLDSFILFGNKGRGVKVCICDTGKPTTDHLQKWIVASENFTSDTTVYDLVSGHSTHVTGTIHEIAPEAELLIAKVLSFDGFGTNRGVADGVRWCYANGAQVINLSLGGSHSLDLQMAVKDVTDAGVLVVSAVGNNGNYPDVDNIKFPAKYPNVIAVGSLDRAFNPSTYSNSGPNGTIMIGGQQIISDWLDGTKRSLSGTSMASPAISALAALYYSNTGSMDGFVEQLTDTATDLLDEGYDWRSFIGAATPKKFLTIRTPEPPKVPEPTEKSNLWVIPLMLLSALAGFLVTYLSKPKS